MISNNNFSLTANHKLRGKLNYYICKILQAMVTMFALAQRRT